MQLFKSPNLYSKLLMFVVLSLAISGGAAFYLIHAQLRSVVYEQTTRVFESDLRAIRTFLLRETDQMQALTQQISNSEGLLATMELKTYSELSTITEPFRQMIQDRWQIGELLIADQEGQVIHWETGAFEILDTEIRQNAFGMHIKYGRHRLFTQTALIGITGQPIGYVVVIQQLTDNTFFFQRLRDTLGKDVVLLEGPYQIGSTFPESPGIFQRTDVTDELFTAFNDRFIGTERDIEALFSGYELQVLILESLDSFNQYLNGLYIGTFLFLIILVGTLVLVIGNYFSRNIRKPMLMLRTGLDDIRNGDLETRIYLGKQDEWNVIETALNGMADQLKQSHDTLERKVAERTNELHEALEATQAKEEEIAHINQVTQMLNASLDLDEVMEMLLDSLREIFHFDQMGILLLDENSEKLSLYAAYGEGFTPQRLEQLRQIPISFKTSRSFFVQTIQDDEPYYLPEVTQSLIEQFEDEDRVLFDVNPLKAVLFYPLRVQNFIIGTLVFGNRNDPFRFTEEKLEMLQRYVVQIGTTVRNAQLYDRSKNTRREVEAKNEQLEELSEKLSKYLSPQVYASIFSGKQGGKLESYRKNLTVLFSSIPDFPALTERLESETLTSLLNTYLNSMADVALRYGGTLDKFMGDNIMIFFGDPESRGEIEDALACVSMALEMRERMKILQPRWNAYGVTDPLCLRIGINTGYCTVGNFGSENRMDYTIVGNQVNVAHRLEELADPDEIRLSPSTYACVKDIIHCKRSGFMPIEGPGSSVVTYLALDFYDRDPSGSKPIFIEGQGYSFRFSATEIPERARQKAAKKIKNALKQLGKD